MIVNELGKECMDRCEIDDSTTDLDFYVDKVQSYLFIFLYFQNYLVGF